MADGLRRRFGLTWRLKLIDPGEWGSGRRSGFSPAHRGPGCAIVNQMVQYRARLDGAFGALSDSTRRGILEHLGYADASISDLAAKFAMTLTGMKKHVGVLEEAGLVA